MRAVPAATPFTTPPLVTVATDVLPELHVPPMMLLDKVVVAPVHTEVVPVMAAGDELTVTVVVTLQPVDNLYVIADVPAVTPVTVPEEDPTVATVVVPDVHVPPVVVELKVVVAPVQMPVVPVMDDGSVITVIVVDLVQPDDKV